MQTRMRWGSTVLVVLATACGGATASPGEGSDGGGTGGSSVGTGGSGGGGSGAEAGPTTCTAGSVTFELTSAGSPAFTYCVGNNCRVQWLSVRSPDGQEMPLDHDCVSDCETCQQLGCPALCALPRAMKPEGEHQVWDGTFFTQDHCGPENNACARANCAQPGKYMVTMCAGLKNNPDDMFCMTDHDQQCVDVEFDYPSTTVVKGTVGPIK